MIAAAVPVQTVHDVLLSLLLKVGQLSRRQLEVAHRALVLFGKRLWPHLPLLLPHLLPCDRVGMARPLLGPSLLLRHELHLRFRAGARRGRRRQAEAVMTL